MEAKGDVLRHAQVRKERVILKDHAHPAPFGWQLALAVGNAHPADFDHALVEALEAGDQPQRRRLAAAAGTEQRQQLAARQIQRHAARRFDHAETFDNILQRNAGQIT